MPARDVVFSKDFPRIPEVTLAFLAHLDGAPSITAVHEEETLIMRPLGRRRQHVIPDPHPSSCGSICQEYRCAGRRQCR